MDYVLSKSSLFLMDYVFSRFLFYIFGQICSDFQMGLSFRLWSNTVMT